jgi:hypothetical protein
MRAKSACNLQRLRPIDGGQSRVPVMKKKDVGVLQLLLLTNIGF